MPFDGNRVEEFVFATATADERLVALAAILETPPLWQHNFEWSAGEGIIHQRAYQEYCCTPNRSLAVRPTYRGGALGLPVFMWGEAFWPHGFDHTGRVTGPDLMHRAAHVFGMAFRDVGEILGDTLAGPPQVAAKIRALLAART